MGGWNRIAFVSYWESPCAPAKQNISLSQIWMCFPGLAELPRPQRDLENKSRTENTAVSLCVTTVTAHAMGLHDQSSEPAPSPASPSRATPDLPQHKGEQESGPQFSCKQPQ